MKPLEPNTQFYVTLVQLLIMQSIFFLSIDYFMLTGPNFFEGIRSSHSATGYISGSLDYVWYACVLGLNVFFFSCIQRTCKDFKIHKSLKEYSYSEVMDLLKKAKAPRNTAYNNSAQENKNSMNIVDQSIFTIPEQGLPQSYLEHYAWLRNSHSQKGVSALFKAFFLLLLLLFIFNFIDVLTEYSSVRVLGITMLVAMVLFWGFFIFGMAKVSRGSTEVA